MWFTKKRLGGRLFAGGFYTNMPPHWSLPQLQRALEEGDDEELEALFLNAIADDLSTENNPLERIRERRVEMYDEGFLTIPLSVSDCGQEYDLFFYPSAEQH